MLPLTRGLYSTAGRFGLFACGILGGALMAVFGQVYQTGADDWELFRAWALFLLPLALLGRQTGLWLASWFTADLAARMYFLQVVTSHGATGFSTDPRSLMQGDYMTLDLDVEEDISYALWQSDSEDKEAAGFLPALSWCRRIR